MALGFSKPKYSPIAIDFGSDSLKLMQLSLDDPPQLIALACTVIPQAARAESGARMRFLAEALNDMLASQPFKGRRAICSIPAFQTLIQHLELEKSEHEDLNSQVGLQLIQRFDIDPSRMVIRTHLVGKTVRDGKTLQQVLCIAAKRDSVMRYIDLANRCKLEVVGMHSEPMAIMRAQPRLTECRDVVCCVDIGGGITKLVIAHDQELVFAKTIHASGDGLTCAFAQEHNISFDEARGRRQRCSTPVAAGADQTRADGAQPVNASGGGSEPQSQFDECETIESLIDELRLSIRYYQTVFPDKPIRKLVFLGGESHDVEICKTLARSVRLAAQVGDPLLGIDTLDGPAELAGGVGNHPRPEWAVPLGLCLSDANL